MTWVLVRKLLRDLRVAAIVVAVPLVLFQLLWSRITSRVSDILKALQANFTLEALQALVLGPNDALGQMVQAIIGGEDIALSQPSMT